MNPLYFLIFFFFLDILIELALRYDQKKQNQFKNQKPPSASNSETKVQLDELTSELKNMQLEASKYNTTETFAKYSKIQRQMIPKQQKIEQLQIQYEKECDNIKQEWETKQKSISKPTEYQPFIMLGQVAIVLFCFIYVKPIYFKVASISYDQLFPINYLIAKRDEIDPDQINISLSYWVIQCFNFFRISKTQLGMTIL